VLARYFFLCDFPFFTWRKRGVSQNKMLVKNAAQQEMPKPRYPRQQGKV
jgi:hypothetical protein